MENKKLAIWFSFSIYFISLMSKWWSILNVIYLDCLCFSRCLDWSFVHADIYKYNYSSACFLNKVELKKVFKSHPMHKESLSCRFFVCLWAFLSAWRRRQSIILSVVCYLRIAYNFKLDPIRSIWIEQN